MSSIRRFFKIIYGMLLILSAVLLLIKPKEAAIYVILVLDIALLIYGLRMFVYYFTMARFMVGGIVTLYKSIIVIDFGLFIFYLDNLPYRLMMLYLVAIMGLHSITTILGSFEMKRVENRNWKIRLAYGVITMMLAIGSLFMFETENIVTIIFCIGLINSAFYNIVAAFRKSAIIYIG